MNAKNLIANFLEKLADFATRGKFSELRSDNEFLRLLVSRNYDIGEILQDLEDIREISGTVCEKIEKLERHSR